MFTEEVKTVGETASSYTRETALLSVGSLYAKSDNSCKNISKRARFSSLTVNLTSQEPHINLLSFLCKSIVNIFV